MAVIYLNNATTGWPKLPAAVQAFDDALAAPPSDIRHSAAPAIERARAAVAASLGTPADTVFFPADATLALNCVLRGYLRPGDHCLTDNRQHNAVTRVLYAMSEARSETVALYDTADMPHPDRLLGRLTPATRLVSLMQTGNVTGSVYDVAALIAAIRQAAPQAAVLVDASQSAGTADLAPALLADFVVFPAHKHLHAVPGAAVLVAKRRLAPFIVGGTGTHSARRSMTDYPDNFVEVGTPNVPAILALAAALAEYDRNAPELQRAAERRARRLWDGLAAIPGVTPVGRAPGAARNATVAALVPGSAEGEWVPFLGSQGIVVRGGFHCCPDFHESAPEFRRGTLRLSPGRFTRDDEIDRALSLIDDFCKAAAM